jgi:small subunit ribosomal protein S20
MANKQSALKELRKTKKRTVHNSRIKTNVKHLFRQCMDLIQAGDMENAKIKALEFQQASDKAAKLHIISKNRSARKQSALMAMLNGKRPVEIKLAHGKKRPAKAKKETAPEQTTPVEAEPVTTETTNNEA